MSTTKIKIHYVVTNGGDGSVSVHFCKSNKLAETYDKLEQYYEGWSEDASFETELEFNEEGILLDKYCLDVKKALQDRIDDKWTKENDPDFIRECKKWLEDIEEE